MLGQVYAFDSSIRSDVFERLAKRLRIAQRIIVERPKATVAEAHRPSQPFFIFELALSEITPWSADAIYFNPAWLLAMISP